MKKIISFGLAAVCALSSAGAKAACTAAADVDVSVREAVCAFNLGRAEKSVPVLTRITDKNGDADYIRMQEGIIPLHIMSEKARRDISMLK